MASFLACIIYIVTTLLFLFPLTDARSLARSGPIPPVDDPFYTPPAGYEGNAPGTVLRYRTMPYPLANAQVDIAIGFQILYRTTDALGNAQATVTTLLVPQNASPDKYLTYQTAEDSDFLDCAPSYGLQQGAVNGSTPEIILISAALQHGWYVSVPDYEGPKSAYTVGPQAAYATLDNIRAVLSSASFSGLSPEARTVMWGYSGGALATEWAVEFQSSYAPELTIAGAASGGLPVNLVQPIEFVNGGPNAGLIVAGLNGNALAYPEMAHYINEHLLPATAAEFYVPLTACSANYLTSYSGQNISMYFDNGMGFLYDPVPAAIWQTSGTLGNHGIPTIPLYWYKSVQDEIIPVAEEDALYARYCSGGASIIYQRNLVGNHEEESILGAGAAFAWLTDRVNGLETAPGCVEEEVLVISPGPADVLALGEVTVNLLIYELQQLI